MRNLKKLLAVIVSICIIATITIPAFAAGISEEAQICADLGLLEGDAGAVDETYLGKETQRYQAAIIYLRLFGLEEEALAYEGEDNFSDAKEMKWAEGRNILAYLYDNPELGWVGDAGKFDPYGLATPQMIYKVLLTALGYEEDVDFTWDETLDFAEEKGLSAIADVENITNDDLATAIVEALKVNVKGESKTLVEKLVEDGLVDKDAAIDAGLIEPVPEVVTVSSVYAENLKQVVVEFNGPVEKASAENKDNYKIDGFSFETASLATDGKTVILTLDDSESVKFENQKEYKLTVDGVKDAAGKAVTKADKVAFTPIDTTVPTVTDVIALGTKAIKVVYSEPVMKSTAATTARYKIDGKSIAGTVDYTFPNIVIIKTTVSTGEHTLSVSDVKDYFELKVSVKDLAFTVVEDTAAPEVVSAEAKDLTEVVVEFNEPIKSVGKAYHTSTSKTGTAKINDTKVTFDFSANRLPVNATTITIENVEDYSGNKATRTVDVTPVLDTERPTVTGVKVEKDGTAHKFTVSFSESVTEASAETGSNYVIKDKDAKVVTGKGLNSKGSPASSSITYDNDKKQATFKLTGFLAAGDYTIEISGIEDKAYIKNTMIPYSEAFTIGDTKAPSVSRAWIEETLVSGTTKYDHAIYIEYSEEMAIDGNGNALDGLKYNYYLPANAKYLPLPSDSTLEMITPETVKITLPRNETQYKVSGLKVRITLVSDKAGNYLGTDYVEEVTVETARTPIAINSVKATAKDTLKVEFNGILTNIDTNDFVVVTGSSLSLDSYSVSDGKTTAIFKLENDLNADTTYGDARETVKFKSAASADEIDTADAFGTKVQNGAQITITDEIKPEVAKINDKAFDVTTTGAIQVTVRFNEDLYASPNVTDAYLLSVLSVKINGTEAKIDRIDTTGTDLVITLYSVGGTNVTVKKGTNTSGTITDNDKITPDDNSIFDIELKAANDTVKVIRDVAGNTPESGIIVSAIRSEVD